MDLARQARFCVVQTRQLQRSVHPIHQVLRKNITTNEYDVPCTEAFIRMYLSLPSYKKETLRIERKVRDKYSQTSVVILASFDSFEEAENYTNGTNAEYGRGSRARVPKIKSDTPEERPTVSKPVKKRNALATERKAVVNNKKKYVVDKTRSCKKSETAIVAALQRKCEETSQRTRRSTEREILRDNSKENDASTDLLTECQVSAKNSGTVDKLHCDRQSTKKGTLHHNTTENDINSDSIAVSKIFAKDDTISPTAPHRSEVSSSVLTEEKVVQPTEFNTTLTKSSPSESNHKSKAFVVQDRMKYRRKKPTKNCSIGKKVNRKCNSLKTPKDISSLEMAKSMLMNMKLPSLERFSTPSTSQVLSEVSQSKMNMNNQTTTFIIDGASIEKKKDVNPRSETPSLLPIREQDTNVTVTTETLESIALLREEPSKHDMISPTSEQPAETSPSKTSNQISPPPPYHKSPDTPRRMLDDFTRRKLSLPEKDSRKPSASNKKSSASISKPSSSNSKPSTSNTKPSTSNTKPSTTNTKPSTSNQGASPSISLKNNVDQIASAENQSSGYDKLLKEFKKHEKYTKEMKRDILKKIEEKLEGPPLPTHRATDDNGEDAFELPDTPDDDGKVNFVDDIRLDFDHMLKAAATGKLRQRIIHLTRAMWSQSEVRMNLTLDKRKVKEGFILVTDIDRSNLMKCFNQLQKNANTKISDPKINEVTNRLSKWMSCLLKQERYRKSDDFIKRMEQKKNNSAEPGTNTNQKGNRDLTTSGSDGELNDELDVTGHEEMQSSVDDASVHHEPRHTDENKKKPCDRTIINNRDRNANDVCPLEQLLSLLGTHPPADNNFKFCTWSELGEKTGFTNEDLREILTDDCHIKIEDKIHVLKIEFEHVVLTDLMKISSSLMMKRNEMNRSYVEIKASDKYPSEIISYIFNKYTVPTEGKCDQKGEQLDKWNLPKVCDVRVSCIMAWKSYWMHQELSSTCANSPYCADINWDMYFESYGKVYYNPTKNEKMVKNLRRTSESSATSIISKNYHRLLSDKIR